MRFLNQSRLFPHNPRIVKRWVWTIAGLYVLMAGFGGVHAYLRERTIHRMNEMYAAMAARSNSPPLRYAPPRDAERGAALFYLVSLLGVTSALNYAIRQSAKHSRGKFCGGCNYDMRLATGPTRCPECGVPYDPDEARAIWERHISTPWHERLRRQFIASLKLPRRAMLLGAGVLLLGTLIVLAPDHGALAVLIVLPPWWFILLHGITEPAMHPSP